MKRGVIVLLLLGILLVSPLVLAQEQAQTYSGFNRFIDDVKMFFTFGDNKVMLALEIREKEVNSAMVNTENGDDKDAEKNLERARERLQFVQTGVSEDTAEDVKINVDETISKMGVEERLPKIFETYFLEEEKTGLTAELIIEVEGKEGQTLTREVVRDEGSGQNKIRVVVEGETQGQIQEQTRTREIETRMNEIDDAIADIIVKSMVVENEDVTPDSNVVDSGLDKGPGEPGVVDED